MTEWICPACGYQWIDEQITTSFYEDCPVCDANMVQPAAEYFDDKGQLRPEHRAEGDSDE